MGRTNDARNWQPWPPEAQTMARTALELTRQDWTLTGQTTTARNSRGGGNGYRHPLLSELGNPAGAEEIVERMVALLLIRMVALVTCRLGNTHPLDDGRGVGEKINGGKRQKRQRIYSDYSTTTICRLALDLDQPTGEDNGGNNGRGGDDDYDDSDPDEEPLVPPGLARHFSESSAERFRRNGRRISLDSDDGISDIKQRRRPPFPSQITPAVVAQLRRYVSTICGQYHFPDDVPYHNVEHAYHVFLSANKLLDLMLCECPEEGDGSEDNWGETDLLRGSDMSGSGGWRGNDVRLDANWRGSAMSGMSNHSSGPSSAVTGSSLSGLSGSHRGSTHTTESASTVKRRTGRRRGGLSDPPSRGPPPGPRRPTFGIKGDPLTQLAFLFSALVHDADHTGISNRQLVLESDDLAILYNDQSVAEQRSLAVAFSTLKKEEYRELRGVLFPKVDAAGATATAAGPPNPAIGNEDFFKFRKLVIDLVLVTDIASPERTQIVKSKWKEAFGEAVVAQKLEKSNALKLSGNNSTRSRSSSGLRASAKMPTPTGRRRTSLDRGRDYFRVGNTGGITNSTGNDNNAAADKGLEPTSKVGNNGEAGRKDGNGIAGNEKIEVPTKSGQAQNRRPKYTRQGSSGTASSSSNRAESSDSINPLQQRSTSSSSNRSNTNPLKSSLLSLTDCDSSIRDSLLDCDSIAFDSDSSRSETLSQSESMSDMQSLEDDFDASAVSRSKMNFDPNAVGGGGGTGGLRGSGSGGSLEEIEEGKQQLPGNGEGGSRVGGAVNPRSQRWSTGDLVGDVDLDEDAPPSPKRESLTCDDVTPRQQGNVSGDKVGGARPNRPFAASMVSKPFKPKFIAPPITATQPSSSVSPNSNHRRRKTAMARAGGLSQSMISPHELRLARPRAHSEERRLGVRRALDLAGSTIIAYNTASALRNSTNSNELNVNDLDATGDVNDDDDSADEFKATVVLEQMIRAADVAALLQDWDQSIKWSTRLYKELNNGFLANRGIDPKFEWYENQIKFFDFYILPLAKNLGVMGIFSEGVGGRFARCVKANLARWVEEGGRVTELMMKEDDEERKREAENRKLRDREEELRRREETCLREREEELRKREERCLQQEEELRELRRRTSMEEEGVEGLSKPMGTLTVSSSGDHMASSMGTRGGGSGGSLSALNQQPRVSRTPQRHESSRRHTSFDDESRSSSTTTRSTANSYNASANSLLGDGGSIAIGGGGTGESSLRSSGSKKVARRRYIKKSSMEVGEECVVCGVIGRFSCPVCSSPYCSAKCCRDHKASGCP